MIVHYFFNLNNINCVKQHEDNMNIDIWHFIQSFLHRLRHIHSIKIQASP